MLLTYPNNFTAKHLRTNVLNQKDLEVHLRHKIFTEITKNRNSRETDVYFTKNYTASNIRVIIDELKERGFAVNKFTDLSKSEARKGLKITY